MIDELREVDWMSRSSRKSQKDIEKALHRLEQTLGRQPQESEIAAELGLPPQVFPVFGLCVGTPDPARPTGIKPRLPPAAVLHIEQYDTAQGPATAAAYDERMSAFQAEQAMTPEVWTSRTINRVRTPKSLTGRDRLRAALANLGFALR